MLIRDVHETLKRLALVRPGDRVLVAISGGPDSVALTHALFALAPRFRLTLGLAHLNHQMRESARDDEAFCARLAAELDLPFVAERRDVTAEAHRFGRSLEEQGRFSRYEFLARVARDWGATRIATGHTQNDQAETLLLRLLRGSGTSGLTAIHPKLSLGQEPSARAQGERSESRSERGDSLEPIARRGWGPVALRDVAPRTDEACLVRPLLFVSRADVLRFLASMGKDYREDPTNSVLDFDRNRVRHEALPYLESFNPKVVETLARTANLLRHDEDFLVQETERAFATLVSVEGDSVTLPVDALAGLHPALQRRLVRRVLTRVKGDLRAITARHVEDVLQLGDPGKSGRRLSLPGVFALRSFGEIHLSRPHADSEAPSYATEVLIPGTTEVREASGALEVAEAEGPLPAAAGMSVVIATTPELEPLSVRSPAPGDRFHPLGAPGAKPLRRYLMERRVDSMRRKRVPVVSGRETILWVVGHSVSEASRVRPGAGRLLRLSWKEEGP